MIKNVIPHVVMVGNDKYYNWLTGSNNIFETTVTTQDLLIVSCVGRLLHSPYSNNQEKKFYTDPAILSTKQNRIMPIILSTYN